MVDVSEIFTLNGVEEWIIDIDLTEEDNVFEILQEELEEFKFDGQESLYFLRDKEAETLYISNVPITPNKVMEFYEHEDEEI